MRTERGTRSRGIGSNALASSIILVCRKRPADAPRFNEWCATSDIALPALVVQSDICRDELVFEIEVDAITVTKNEL